MRLALPYDLRPDPGLPMPAYWDPRLDRSAAAQPPGGGIRLLAAAEGYWARRGLAVEPGQVLAAPGAEPLLLALLASTEGEPVLARPSAAWQAPVVRLLGRRIHTVPTPAEGGGVPDPIALMETVRRARADGGDPRLLVLSAVDDPSGTVTPPELLHETCEAAAEAGLLIVSDETYSDTLHHRRTVLLSPAEMLPDHTVVVSDLGATLVPSSVPAALARFPGTVHGAAWRRRTAEVLAALRAVQSGPVGAATTYVLTEPAEVTEFRAAANRLHALVAAAAAKVIIEAGAVCRRRRPPSSSIRRSARPVCGRPVSRIGSPARSAAGCWAASASATIRSSPGCGSTPARSTVPPRRNGVSRWPPRIRSPSRMSRPRWPPSPRRSPNRWERRG